MDIDLSKSKTAWPLHIKIRRGLWTFMLEPLVRWLPKICSPLRIFALRAMGARVPYNCTLLPGVRVLMPWNLSMGDWSALGESVNVYNFAPVSIGSHTVVSQFSYLCTGSHDYRRADMPLIFAPITLGSQVWVAAGSFIAPGVRVADGAVVGAMSVVTRSLVHPWTVYGGNPCRPIKERPLPVAGNEPRGPVP
jgi:putative colanic acid biosynthesis acetyltransferase WcaF